MGFKDWLTKNMCVTTPRDPDPFFHPRSYKESKTQVVQAVQEVISTLSNWKMSEYKEIQGRVHAARRGAWLGFEDDVNIYIVQGSDGITRLEMTSQSRALKGDWGRNRRNIRDFLSKMDAKIPPLGV